MNRDLDYVLNYMVKYTQDRFMQDSEPMLNHRDIELVLKHIRELEQKNEQLKEKIKELNGVIEKVEKMFNHETLIKYYYGMSYEFEINDFKDDILQILGGKE